ncbi:Esterase [Actinidia chinensis var. chinensis]|uniref:Esterase n=1 Tax=Actinidia chinensis var. chinensis TaxID=1590841 RepID=A0A2R6R651_ACTCC|nr:Esterase [Actinidia chinensis var. chinensis]
MALHKLSPLRSTNYPAVPKYLSRRTKTLKVKMEIREKPRVLCLHGYRTSGQILQKQIERWPEAVLGKLDLVFLDGPCPARGKSDVEGFYDPPYFEWYYCNEDFTEYYNFEECLAYLEDYMIKHGPFDGLLGFSQGAILSAVLPGMQMEGVALTKVPLIKFLIIVSGTKFGGYKFGLPKLAANAFASPVKLPSLHFIGERDFLKEQGIALLESFEDPTVIYHNRGHTVPRLDEKGLETMLGFIEKIEKMQLQEKNREELCLD